jgi:hypothetical protein
VLPDIVQGARLNEGLGADLQTLRKRILRWELPPDACIAVSLAARQGRGLDVVSTPSWKPVWEETPLGLWLEGVDHGVVSVNLQYVSFMQGPYAARKQLLIANRADTAAVLQVAQQVLAEAPKTVRVIGGRDVRLSLVNQNWDSIVLDPSVQRLVREDYESFFTRQSWFRRHGLPHCRGYLLHGPPGNGKTTVVRAMAYHPSVSAFSVDLGNPMVDNDMVSLLFQEASENAPSLVIFEDLDRVFQKDQRRHPRSMTLPHLLNCLDGLGERDGVIVVASANDPTGLDPSILRRPGRFDRLVYFPPPSLAMRAEYLKLLSGGSLAPDAIDLTARRSEGFSFAQLRESYVLAGQFAWERDADVERLDLLEGIKLVALEASLVRMHPEARSVGFGQSGQSGAEAGCQWNGSPNDE